MYYLTDFNGTTIVPYLQMIHSLYLEELSVFLNLCDSQSVLFSISVFLNLCDSQLVFFSICAFLNQCFSQLVLFSISAIWGRHPMLYFNIPRTKKCSKAMCQHVGLSYQIDCLDQSGVGMCTANCKSWKSNNELEIQFQKS